MYSYNDDDNGAVVAVDWVRTRCFDWCEADTVHTFRVQLNREDRVIIKVTCSQCHNVTELPLPNMVATEMHARDMKQRNRIKRDNARSVRY